MEQSIIDIHSHILFGVDDGAKNIQESITLLRQAEKLGITDIVCSSHFYLGRYENKDYNKNFEILENEIKKQGIKIKIYKGNELALFGDVLSKVENVNTINNSKYVLVELRRGFIFSLYKGFLQKLIDLGYKPILAHIERYPFIKFNEFIELYNMGVIFQMNIKTVKNLTPKMKHFLIEGYVKVVATDVHNTEFRNYELQIYFDELEKLVGESRVKELAYENPKKILNNEDIILVEIKGANDEVTKINSSSGLFKSIWNKLFGRA